VRPSLKYPGASHIVVDSNKDVWRKPSKRVCALCSTTAIPSEDDCKTAYLQAVMDRKKAQPAATGIARLKTKKDEYPRLIGTRAESSLFVVRVCGCAFTGASRSVDANLDNESGRASFWLLLFHAHARIVGNSAWVEALGQGRGAPRSARFSLDAELTRPILAEPGWHSGRFFGKDSLSLMKAHCGPKLRCARSSSLSSFWSVLLFLWRLKNSSRTLTTIALMLTPSDSAHSFSAALASGPT